MKNSAEAVWTPLSGRVDPALPLDGLDYQGSHVLRHHLLDALQVPESEVPVGVGDEGLERLLYALLACGTHRRRRPPVEPVQRREHLGAPRVADRRLQRALVGLSPAVAEQRPVQLPGGDGRDPLGQLGLLLHVVQVGDVGHPGGLLLDSPCHVRMGVAEGVDRDAGHQVQVLPPVAAVQVASASVCERQGYAAVVLEQVAVALLLDFVEIHCVTS